MTDMLTGDFDNAIDMAVIQTVINIFALEAVFDQIAQENLVQLMRDR